jgi:chromate transporter
MSVIRNAAATTAAPSSSMLREFVLYFLKLGTLGFGGPIALAGYMQRDLVEERAWIAPEDYKQGLALAQLAPGPLAAQLAIYLGWVRGRVWGATLVAAAFIGPSFLMVVGLSALYVRFGGLPWMRAVFYGVGAAVIAIIARSALKLVRMTLGPDRLLWLLFALSMFVTAWTETEVVWLFAACGIAPMLARGRQGKVLETNTLSVAAWPFLFAGSASASMSIGLLGTMFGYFASAALFVFGSGLAIVPFLHGGVVLNYHWLTERQFLDAVAVSMITPGPVVITVAFIGYLVAGPLGAIAAAAGVFLPTYLVVVAVAPSFRRVVGNAWVKSFVSGVTAAATGAIAGAVIVLGRRALVDLPTILIGLATLGLLLTPRKIPEPLIIAAAGTAGLLLSIHRLAP